MISKEKFVEYIKTIKEFFDRQYKIYKVMSETFIDTQFLIYSGELELMIKMLSDLMELDDDNNDIDYFVYELDFGHNDGASDAVKINGKTYDLSSAEKLYDYLVEIKEVSYEKI